MIGVTFSNHFHHLTAVIYYSVGYVTSIRNVIKETHQGVELLRQESEAEPIEVFARVEQSKLEWKIYDLSE